MDFDSLEKLSENWQKSKDLHIEKKIINLICKNNKNHFVIAFCSLLTTRLIFKEVIVGFLIVGHTHEDIDTHFSYLSKLKAN